jgi:branched-chain amino acid transport system permease protein
MDPRLRLREQRNLKLQQLVHHPYFGFVVLGGLMLLVQLLQSAGVPIPVSIMRAFGLTMIYIVIGLGFAILLGYAGLASLGTAGFVGIGTYALGYLTNTRGFSVGMVVFYSVLGAIVLGVIVGFISLRIEGMYLAIITLGLSEILNEIFKNAVTITNGTNGLLMPQLVFFGNYYTVSNETVFAAVAVVLVLTMFFTYNIIKSPTGRAMLAMKNSESAAQAMGVSVLKYRLLAFIIATVFALVGGILYMAYIKYTIPTTWSLAFSLNLLAAVIVGGSRSIWGIVLGSFMIFGLDLAVFQRIIVTPDRNAAIAAFIARFPDHQEALRTFFVNLQQSLPVITYILNGLLIILVVMFYPGGLYQLVLTIKTKLVAAWKNAVRKWKVRRYGQEV